MNAYRRENALSTWRVFGVDMDVACVIVIVCIRLEIPGATLLRRLWTFGDSLPLFSVPHDNLRAAWRDCRCEHES
eukprot:scaffold87554_cov32-Tisochrysis_lutea.AAC.2